MVLLSPSFIPTYRLLPYLQGTRPPSPSPGQRRGAAACPSERGCALAVTPVAPVTYHGLQWRSGQLGEGEEGREGGTERGERRGSAQMQLDSLSMQEESSD